MASNSRIYNRCCPSCGVSFVAIKSQKFCTKQCRERHHYGLANVLTSVACKGCATEFLAKRHQKFCNKKCSQRFFNAINNKTEKVRLAKKEWENNNRDRITNRQRIRRVINQDKWLNSGKDKWGRKLESKRKSQAKYRTGEVYKKRKAREAAKMVSEIRDCYVANKLRVPVSKLTPDIIELKRQQLRLHRILKHIQENEND